MSMRYVEKFGLPVQFRDERSDKFKDCFFGMCMQAVIMVPGKGVTILQADGLDQEFSDLAKTNAHETPSKLRIPIKVVKWGEFKRVIQASLSALLSVYVTVILVRQGKCETFTSFFTGSSQQVHRGFMKGIDLLPVLKKKKKNVNNSISSKYSDCAYCLHEFGGDGTCAGCCDGCVKCDEEVWSRGLRVCQGCKSVFYCSETCQKLDWARGHKVACHVFYFLTPRFYPQLASDQDFINEIWKTAMRFLPPAGFQIPDSFGFQGMKDVDM